jgi:hypothetical protein
MPCVGFERHLRLMLMASARTNKALTAQTQAYVVMIEHFHCHSSEFRGPHTGVKAGSLDCLVLDSKTALHGACERIFVDRQLG